MDIPAVKRLLCLLDAVKNADYIESRAEAERGFVDGFYDAVRECHSRLCEECPTRLLHLPGAFDGYVGRDRPSYAPEPDYDQLAEIARMDAEEATEAQRLAREEGL